MHKRIAVYDNSISARTYLSYIAEQAGGFACIGRDGKLYIKRIGESIVEIPLKYFKQGYEFGEKIAISRVKYEDGMQVFERGDETGSTVYISQENMYIVDQEQIDEIYNQINGLELYGFKGECIIDPAIDIGDILTIDGKKILYQGSMKYSGKWQCDISSKLECKEKQETTSKTQSQKNINRKVESKISQIDGSIEQLVEETSENSEKIVQATQDINGLKQRVENIENFTREQTEYNQIHLTDTIEGSGYITEFTIYGSTDNFKYLAPSNNLTPSNNLVPLGDHFTLVIDNKLRGSKDENSIELDVLLGEPLRNIGNICDEFRVYGNEATVLRRIGVDENNNLYQLDTPIVEQLGKLEIPTFEGNTYIYIDEYFNLKYNAKYIIKNNYSETYATKSELKSSITESEKNINISVNEKLEGYSTTQETQAMIDVQANQIRESVERNYVTQADLTKEKSERVQTEKEINQTVSTKVGENEVVSVINQSSDLIDIEGNRIKIKSDYFELTEDGKIIAASGKIGGFELNTNDFKGNLNGTYNFTIDDFNLLMAYLNGNINLSNSLKELYKLDNRYDELNIFDALYMADIINGKEDNPTDITGSIEINSKDLKKTIVLKDQYDLITTVISIFGITTQNLVVDTISVGETSNNKFIGITIDKDENKIIITDGTDVTEITPNKISTTDLYVNYIKNTPLIKNEISASSSYNGYPMTGTNDDHKYACNWDGSNLQFYVDTTYAGALSDKRLKSNFADIDKNLIKAVDELKIQQFNIDNRKLVNVGVIAQDLIKVSKKYNIDIFNYQIIDKVKYKAEDKKEYYKIDYIQYLVIKQLATELKMKEKDNIINNLIKRVEKLEKGGK